MSSDHILLHGCEIADTSEMLIVPYPNFVPVNLVMHPEDVNDGDNDLEEEH
ncbi:MAG: hypothetical protein HON99_01465, partial [Crocinitomicaceae bacterium]|nr:hypothetical protein [Crocinitomicaceae bacterium]